MLSIYIWVSEWKMNEWRNEWKNELWKGCYGCPNDAVRKLDSCQLCGNALILIVQGGSRTKCNSMPIPFKHNSQWPVLYFTSHSLKLSHIARLSFKVSGKCPLAMLQYAHWRLGSFTGNRRRLDRRRQLVDSDTYHLSCSSIKSL